MFKKLVLVSAIMATSSSIVLAATPYVGGSVGFGGYGSQSGEMATLFGGYGTTVGQHKTIYLGGELNADVGHYSNYKTLYGLGASFIPGVMLSHYTMLYGRLGLNSIYNSHRTIYKHNSTNNYWGTQYGLGVQTEVMKNWDIRGEYVYTTIRNLNQYNLGLVYKFE